MLISINLAKLIGVGFNKFSTFKIKIMNHLELKDKEGKIKSALLIRQFPTASRVLVDGLTKEGFEVDLTGILSEARELLKAKMYNLVVTGLVFDHDGDRKLEGQQIFAGIEIARLASEEGVPQVYIATSTPPNFYEIQGIKIDKEIPERVEIVDLEKFPSKDFVKKIINDMVVEN